MTFSNWHDGEPNGWNDDTAHCLELTYDKWNAQNCNEKRKFICESQ